MLGIPGLNKVNILASREQYSTQQMTQNHKTLSSSYNYYHFLLSIGVNFKLGCILYYDTLNLIILIQALP